MVIHSYAKLNLYLEVAGKRSDGYHDLKTVFERISLYDTITFLPRRDGAIRIVSSSPELPSDPLQNLIFRSAELFRKTFGIPEGLTIRITKRIPVGAGLGGGSSNAAYTLLGLNRLWKVNAGTRKLVQLASSIGSDVPFFVYDRPFALGEGRGERISSAGIPAGVRLWHVLVVPRFAVATPAVYAAWDRSLKRAKTPAIPTLIRSTASGSLGGRIRRSVSTLRQSPALKPEDKGGLTLRGSGVKILVRALRRKDLILLGESLHNGLQEVATAIHPEIKRIRQRLRQAGLKAVLMSGSGPAVFGVVNSRKEAVAVCRQLRQEEAAWRVFAVYTR